jgi:hypothetical protein
MQLRASTGLAEDLVIREALGKFAVMSAVRLSV